MSADSLWGILVDITQIVSSIAALGAAIRWGVIPVRKGVRRIMGAVEQVEQHTELLSKVVKEVLPNGGTSIKDAVVRIESRQVRSEQRQLAHLNQIAEPILECDANGDCIWANRTYLTLTGKQFNEIQGNGWLTTVCAEDRERVFDEWSSAIRQHREAELAYNLHTSDGKTRPVKCKSYIMRSADNKPIGFIRTLVLPKTPERALVCAECPLRAKRTAESFAECDIKDCPIHPHEVDVHDLLEERRKFEDVDFPEAK